MEPELFILEQNRPFTFKMILADDYGNNTITHKYSKVINEMLKNRILDKINLQGVRCRENLFYLRDKKYYIVICCSYAGFIAKYSYYFCDQIRIINYSLVTESYSIITQAYELQDQTWQQVGDKLINNNELMLVV
jgi:hypothetical protein